MTGAYGALFWLVLAVVLILIEAASVQLVCIWFAAGSLGAMIAAGLGASLWLQLLVFLLFSIGSLFLGRPLLKDRLMSRKEATNADRAIGETGIVLEDIDNLNETGRARVMGLDWTARSGDGHSIPAQSRIRVLRIEGVKLIVEPADGFEERG